MEKNSVSINNSRSSTLKYKDQDLLLFGSSRESTIPINNEIISTEKREYGTENYSIDAIDFGIYDLLSSSSENSSISFTSSFNESTSSLENYSWSSCKIEYDKRQTIIDSKWGGFALHMRLWDDDNAPVIKVKTIQDFELSFSEYTGILSDRVVGACSTFLSKSPENGLYVLSKCQLKTMNLRDISILRYHRYIQYLDLSYNNLTDITALSDIPYLMYLNVSHNRLQNVLRFSPPWYLTYVNLSHNDITVIDDLSEFWSIVRLDLSHNAIENITGLQNLKHLHYLNLSYNLIEVVENLDKMNIQELNLEYNCISSFVSRDPEDGIKTLPNLRTLIMGHNKIMTLEFFKGAYGLRLIDLKYNKIADLMEVSHLKSFVYEVDLRGNPCTKWPNYRDVLLFTMPSVMYVDGAGVSITEKVSAAEMFAPSVELISARNVTKLVLLEQLNIPKIDMHVSPYDEVSPPIIILSGPSTVKKTLLAKTIANALPKRVRFCRNHTTRDGPDCEEDMECFHFVKREDFNEMVRRGEFLAIQELLGHSYGFHINEIALVASEKKIGITQMDLFATIQMESRYANTKMVMVLTKDEDLHRQWIKDKFEIFTWMKDSVENLLAVKIGGRVGIDSVESSLSKMDFITEIVNDVIEDLDLPTYGIWVRPQGTGATATDIILESQTLLPKVTVTRSQLELEEKKHITFRGEQQDDITHTVGPVQTSEEQFQKYSELKVLLDEKSNIIIEDEDSKRKKQREKVLLRRSQMKFEDAEFVPIEELDEDSSEESIPHAPRKKVDHPDNLKDEFVKVVIASRRMYIDHHLNNPGFYSLVLFVDDFKNAFNSLMDFIYEVYINHPLRKPRYDFTSDKLPQELINNKITLITNQFQEQLSTGKMQQKTLSTSYGLTSSNEVMDAQMTLQEKDFFFNMESHF
ncbi:uncharacterized protein LOC107274789 [Cephus cinctus]|uniref:Dynein axonemal assembly factor 1 homolog n=1 Tax=Cephus cinctus TaxID=211228 RepID=A0AAJ7CHA4_CEPCN|nr:uncharacterized protein LOC107274789 [Cephus cinctus]